MKPNEEQALHIALRYLDRRLEIFLPAHPADDWIGRAKTERATELYTARHVIARILASDRAERTIDIDA